MANLDDICLDLAWRHWTALGVRGAAKPPEDAIDLEAIILFTATLRDADPRLYDEALDWCVRFGGDCVSVSRLRRLLARLPADQQAAFGELAGAVHQHVDLKWPNASAHPQRRRVSGKSRLRAPASEPSLLQLRVRRLFGVAARVEILMSLVMTREGELASATDLAHLGYAKQNVAAVLDDLADAGVVERVHRGNQHHYRLLRRDTWRALLAPLPRSWPPWMLRLPVLAGLRTTLEKVAEKADIVRDVEISKELERHLPAFRALGYADSGIPIQGHSSRGIIEWAVTMLTGPSPGFETR